MSENKLTKAQRKALHYIFKHGPKSIYEIDAIEKGYRPARYILKKLYERGYLEMILPNGRYQLTSKGLDQFYNAKTKAVEWVDTFAWHNKIDYCLNNMRYLQGGINEEKRREESKNNSEIS